MVVQLPYSTDIQSLLGEHKWSVIAKKWDGDPNDPRASCIFEYNFRNNGDPGNREFPCLFYFCCAFTLDLLADNWTDQYPNPLPEGVIVPAKSPYPEPNWAEPPSSIRSLVFPIPFRSPPRIPEPEPTPTPVPVKMTPLLPSIPTSSSLQSTPISPPPPVDITVSCLWLKILFVWLNIYSQHSDLMNLLCNTQLMGLSSIRLISQKVHVQIIVVRQQRETIYPA